MFDKVIIIGIFISLIYSEITGFSASGLIVPGYIALNMNNFDRIFFTLGVSLVTYIIIKILNKYMIIYGKRQFSMCVGISVLINFLLVSFILPGSFGVIGNIVPGIIANEWLKEGVVPSLVSLFVVVGIIVIVMLLLSMPVF